MVCSTLCNVKKQLQKTEKDPACELELADRAEHSLAIVQAFLAGMGAERVWGALKEMHNIREVGREAQQGESSRGHQRDMGR